MSADRSSVPNHALRPEVVLECLLHKTRPMQLFGDDAARRAVDEFFALKFDDSYRNSVTPAEAADHAYGFICARAATAAGHRFHFSAHNSKTAFYVCEATYDDQQETEHRIAAFLEKQMQPAHAISIRTYQSQAHEKVDVVLYLVEILPFLNAKPPAGCVDLEQLTSERFLTWRTKTSQDKYQKALALLEESIAPVWTVNRVDEKNLALKIAFKRPDRMTYLPGLTTLLSRIPSSVIYKKFMETFSNGNHVYTFYIRGANEMQVKQAATLIGMLPNRPERLTTQLYNKRKLNAHEVIYAQSLVQFAFYFTPPTDTEDFLELTRDVAHRPVSVQRLKNLRNSLFREIMTEHFVGRLMDENLGLVRLLYQDFREGTTVQSAAKLGTMIDTALRHRSKLEKEIFRSFLKFNSAVVKHNFSKINRAAVVYRLNPSFIADCDFPRVPHGIFMFLGPQFRGFHVRFNDIARGGVRMILSHGNKALHDRNKTTLFQENYNLAYAQLLKNKDIPEGGSKGTILVSERFTMDARTIYLQYVDALLDLIIPGVEGVYSTMTEPEILFLGPDENTAGVFPTIAAEHARSRGYKQWKSLTTGKSPVIGGIPHDTYGMTSQGVRQNARCLYERLNLREDTLTKFQTAGPDGDLGSNEILLGNETWVGLCDGAGSLHDPEGVNKEELLRLAKARLSLANFDKKKLSSKGFFVSVKDSNVKLPDGTIVEDGTIFRNNFHFSNYARADIFVPCGGRPASISLENVHKLTIGVHGATGQSMLEHKVGDLRATDQLRYKYIVEGANLFITHDARLALEAVGVQLIKDSTANKGGVTCSSFEVLAGLALTDKEHGELMSVKGDKVPEFYASFVKEIIERIQNNAKKEFKAIWTAVKAERCGGCYTLVSDELSQKIVKLRSFISNSNVFETEKQLVRHVMTQYVPETLLAKVPLETFMARVPKAYLEAIFAIWIASDFVYSVGLDATEFSFFEYMHKLTAIANRSIAAKL